MFFSLSLSARFVCTFSTRTKNSRIRHLQCLSIRFLLKNEFDRRRDRNCCRRWEIEYYHNHPLLLFQHGIVVRWLGSSCFVTSHHLSASIVEKSEFSSNCNVPFNCCNSIYIQKMRSTRLHFLKPFFENNFLVFVSCARHFSLQILFCLFDIAYLMLYSNCRLEIFVLLTNDNRKANDNGRSTRSVLLLCRHSFSFIVFKFSCVSDNIGIAFNVMQIVRTSDADITYKEKNFIPNRC